MTYNELIKKTAKKSGLSQRLTSEVLEALVYVVIENVYKGEKVHIKNLCEFSSRVRHARNCPHPQTGEIINVPAVRVPKVRMMKAFKDIVKKK